MGRSTGRLENIDTGSVRIHVLQFEKELASNAHSPRSNRYAWATITILGSLPRASSQHRIIGAPTDRVGRERDPASAFASIGPQQSWSAPSDRAYKRTDGHGRQRRRVLIGGAVETANDEFGGWVRDDPELTAECIVVWCDPGGAMAGHPSNLLGTIYERSAGLRRDLNLPHDGRLVFSWPLVFCEDVGNDDIAI